MTNPIGSVAAWVATKIRPDDVELKRKLAGIEGRTIAQADAMHIPFVEDQFDVVMAYASIHQIPAEKRETAFRELIRVGKRIHLSPIFQVDLKILGKLEKELGFSIISCASPPDFFSEKLPFEVKSLEDYQSYLQEHPSPEDRIVWPEAEDVRYKGRVSLMSGGCSIILCKDKYLSPIKK